MPGEKTKRTVTMFPTTLLVYFVCLIGLSVAATYSFVHAKYLKQLNNKDLELLDVQKSNKALADGNIELQNSLLKAGNDYGKLEAQYKDLASKLDTVGRKNAETASELEAASKDLEAAKADAGKLADELEAKSSETDALNAGRQTLEKKYDSYQEMLAPYLVLEPTWVSPAETTRAFDGNLLVVLYTASDKGKCYKDTVALCYLFSGANKEVLCLRTGQPESFKYQGKKYLFNLVEAKDTETAKRYCISIFKQW